ncbi:hypothetical protein BJY04DRAFT_200407 [Aspergillus karnatakaensis]|uniref:uncharacterized protein n=1 Tax=Aspergillus karnatakaensis TaxID=1810916 RepID=UPI003CCD1AB6
MSPLQPLLHNPPQRSSFPPRLRRIDLRVQMESNETKPNLTQFIVALYLVDMKTDKPPALRARDIGKRARAFEVDMQTHGLLGGFQHNCI